MSLRAMLFNAPSTAVSRPRLVVSAAGLLLLAALVVAHAIVLTAFLGSSTNGQGRPVVVGLVWLVSAVALLFIARGLRYVVLAWRAA